MERMKCFGSSCIKVTATQVVDEAKIDALGEKVLGDLWFARDCDMLDWGPSWPLQGSRNERVRLRGPILRLNLLDYRTEIRVV